MTIREGLMTLGSFDVQLIPETPWGVRSDLQGFGLLVVTPEWSPDVSLTQSALLALSRYTGVVRVLTDQRRSIGGTHLAVLMGDEDGKGDCAINAAGDVLSGVGDTLSDAIDTLVTYCNGITAGSVKSYGPSFLSVLGPGVTPRQWLDTAIDYQFAGGFEWRVNPSGSLDVNTAAALFDTTPTTLIGNTITAPDTSLVVLQAVLRGTSLDVEDWCHQVRVYDTGSTSGSTATIGTNPYNGIDGTDLEMRIYEIVEDEDEAARAAQILVEHQDARREITVTADASVDVREHVEPGDSVYLYAPDEGIEDTDNQVVVNGQVIHPESVRVAAITWPVRRGMGVYHVSSDGNQTVTDLTPYVAWETADVTLEVGDQRRTL